MRGVDSDFCNYFEISKKYICVTVFQRSISRKIRKVPPEKSTKIMSKNGPQPDYYGSNPVVVNASPVNDDGDSKPSKLFVLY